MQIQTKLILGGVTYTFNIEDAKEMDALHKAIVISNPRLYCNLCKNNLREKFRLDSNKDTKGNIYVNLVCTSCGAKSKLGQYQVGGYFWRDFEKYDPSKKES